jgi:hypothetical protein
MHLNGFDENGEYHCKALQLRTEMLESLRLIAENGNDTNTILKEMRKDNRNAMNLVAGKGQVPLVVFLVVIVCLSTIYLIDKASSTQTNVTMSPNEMTIGSNDKARSKDTTQSRSDSR